MHVQRMMLVGMMLLGLSLAQPIADGEPYAAPSRDSSAASAFWVSASYSVPSRLSLGMGVANLWQDALGLDVQLALRDDASLGVELSAMYYLDAPLPAYTALYARAGASATFAPFSLAAQAGIGLEYRLHALDFEALAAFIELSPSITVVPHRQLGAAASLGLRAHF